MELEVQFVEEYLQQLGIKDEAVEEYVRGLLIDSTLDVEEKRDAVREFLSEAATTSLDETFLDDLFARLKLAEEALLVSQENARRQALLANKEAERAALTSSAASATAVAAAALNPWSSVIENEMASSSSRRDMTLAERKERDKLLAKYGYDMDETVETADGEIEFIYKDRSDADAAALTGLGENRNAQIVVEKEQQKRAEAKDQQQRLLLRQKELDLREKERKEKAKRKTEKHERRRGPS